VLRLTTDSTHPLAAPPALRQQGGSVEHGPGPSRVLPQRPRDDVREAKDATELSSGRPIGKDEWGRGCVDPRVARAGAVS
jgi:hypothetical protein